MFKKLKKLITAGLVACSMMVATTSCSLMGDNSEGVMISAISATTNNNGDTELTITFTDDEIEPVTFLIPKGETGDVGQTGADGVGIKSITSSQSEDGTKTILTITYSNDEVSPTNIEVNNGVSVVDINSLPNLDNNTTVITFILSDGTTKTVEVPNGKDGIGIKDVVRTDADNGDVIITISYTGGREDSVITLPYKVGEDGRGIETIVGNQVDDLYTITINYTDGTSEELAPFLIPASTKWMSGIGSPTNFEKQEANEGDYYFDLENYIIYIFSGGDFYEVINLTEDHMPTKTYQVTFDANGGKFTTTQLRRIEVNAGRPIPLASIPAVAKDGCEFIGWYTTPEGPANPMSGRLTDLTPIYSDMTFYAQYKAI